MKELFDKIRTPLLISLTLGLAPFVPEPHILGKLRWVAGGANGMQALDWLDLVFHGFSWVWLVVALILAVAKQVKYANQS